MQAQTQDQDDRGRLLRLSMKEAQDTTLTQRDTPLTKGEIQQLNVEN